MPHLFSLTENKTLHLIHSESGFHELGALLIQCVHKLDASFVKKQEVSVHSRMRCLFVQFVHQESASFVQFVQEQDVLFINKMNHFIQFFHKQNALLNQLAQE